MKNIKLIVYLSVLIFISCQTGKKEMSRGLPLSNQWIISNFENQDTIPVVKNSIITIDEKGNTFNGNGACNTISGTIIRSGNTLKFTKIIATRMACSNSEQETTFIKALKKTTNFKISGCELFLFQGNKKIATLESCR